MLICEWMNECFAVQCEVWLWKSIEMWENQMYTNLCSFLKSTTKRYHLTKKNTIWICVLLYIVRCSIIKFTVYTYKHTETRPHTKCAERGNMNLTQHEYRSNLKASRDCFDPLIAVRCAERGTSVAHANNRNTEKRWKSQWKPTNTKEKQILFGNKNDGKSKDAIELCLLLSLTLLLLFTFHQNRKTCQTRENSEINKTQKNNTQRDSVCRIIWHTDFTPIAYVLLKA